MKYKVIKGIKGIKKFKNYKNLKYRIDENTVRFYITDDIQKMIFKKHFKYLGIIKVDDIIDMIDIPKNIDKLKYDEYIKKYIDTRLKGFMKKLENVVEYYGYYKQIQSQNARIRVSSWFDKGDYRHLAWLKEQKENIEKKMKV